MGNPKEAPWKVAQGYTSTALQEQVKFPCGKYCEDGWAAGFFYAVIYSARKDVLWLEQQAVQVASLLHECSRCVGTMHTQNSTHLCPLIYLHTSRATVSVALRIQHRALRHSTLCVSPHLMMALLGAHFSLHCFIGTFTQGHSHATSVPSFTISDVIF